MSRVICVANSGKRENIEKSSPSIVTQMVPIPHPCVYVGYAVNKYHREVDHNAKFRSKMVAVAESEYTRLAQIPIIGFHVEFDAFYIASTHSRFIGIDFMKIGSNALKINEF